MSWWWQVGMELRSRLRSWTACLGSRSSRSSRSRSSRSMGSATTSSSSLGVPPVSFWEDWQQGYTFPVHYFVVSTKVGAQMDGGRIFRDDDKRLVLGVYKGRMS